MEEQEMVQITVTIAGRPYPLKIKEGDQPTINEIVKGINKKISDFKLAYNKRDEQDCMSMTLLTYAVDLHKARQAEPTVQQADTNLTTQVEQLDALLDDLLK